MTGLQSLEEWMLATITHPQGVLAGATQATERGSIASLTTVVHATREWSAESRLGIYWNAYFARLQECLRTEFPIVLQAVGEEAFDEFAFEYLQIHPPASYTLGRLGAEFPAFLAASRPPRDTEVPDWADFVADLARFEWTLSEVFDGPGAERIEVDSVPSFLSIHTVCLAAATVTCPTCLRLENYQFPVHLYYAAVKRGDSPELPEPQPSFVAVSRKAFTVQHFALSANEFALLQRLKAGDPLGPALETVCGTDEDRLSEVGKQIASWFHAWMRTGLIVGLQIPDRL